jgi:hypothetical protein
MPSEPISMVGTDFLTFAGWNSDIWLKMQGAEIKHETFGVGEIEAVQLRKGYSPLFSVRFLASSKLAKFNSEVFKSGKIKEVKVPCLLSEALLVWKKQLEINAAREAEMLAERRRLCELRALEAAEKDEEVLTRINGPTYPPCFDYESSIESLEKYAATKRDYYAGALPARIQWLNKWSEKIQSGANGLEPAWGRGKAVSDYLLNQGIFHLWHFTDLRNLESIRRERGLLSWAGVSARGIDGVHMVADEFSRRCDERLGREYYVRLSFIPNSWFFHRVRNKTRLVWMRFSLRALSLGEVYYSFGNAASGYVSLQDDVRSMNINWKIVKSFGDSGHTDEKGLTRYPVRYRSQVDDPAVFNNERDSWNSEVLIKHFLPIGFCTAIYDSNTGERLQRDES